MPGPVLLAIWCGSKFKGDGVIPGFVDFFIGDHQLGPPLCCPGSAGCQEDPLRSIKEALQKCPVHLVEVHILDVLAGLQDRQGKVGGICAW